MDKRRWHRTWHGEGEGRARWQCDDEHVCTFFCCCQRPPRARFFEGERNSRAAVKIAWARASHSPEMSSRYVEIRVHNLWRPSVHTPVLGTCAVRIFESYIIERWFWSQTGQLLFERRGFPIKPSKPSPRCRIQVPAGGNDSGKSLRNYFEPIT